MMKKLLGLALLMMLSIGAYSQSAIGIRGGVFGVDGNSYGGLEVSYTRIGSMELDFGWTGNNSYKFTYLKQFGLVGDANNFLLYAGLGAGLGAISSQFHANAAVDVGVSWKLLNFLQLSLDYRPEWAITSNSYTETSFSWNNIALGLRYAF